MIKLLIVDEDDEQRSKIIKSICWNRIGVYICGEASTGRVQYSQYLRHDF